MLGGEKVVCVRPQRLALGSMRDPQPLATARETRVDVADAGAGRPKEDEAPGGPKNIRDSTQQAEGLPQRRGAQAEPLQFNDGFPPGPFIFERNE